ncbi:MAG: hypothetical protein FWC91_10020 [Defluviitaleaceae bacterium]|nr:hypothetical protein [Defluviitaleaceae bacterium]
MQSILLKIGESINLVEFVDKIQSIYGNKKVKPALSTEISAKMFGELPNIFLNPIPVDNFQIYSREELNER